MKITTNGLFKNERVICVAIIALLSLEKCKNENVIKSHFIQFFLIANPVYGVSVGLIEPCGLSRKIQRLHIGLKKSQCEASGKIPSFIRNIPSTSRSQNGIWTSFNATDDENDALNQADESNGMDSHFNPLEDNQEKPINPIFQDSGLITEAQAREMRDAFNNSTPLGLDWMKTLEALQASPKSPVPAHLITYNAALSAAERNCSADFALEVLEDMRRKSTIDAVSYRLAIGACIKCNRVEEAIALFEEMLKCKYVADHGLLRNLLWLFSKHSGQAENAIKILDSLKNLEKLCKGSNKLIIPNDYMDTIDACINSQQYGDALELYYEMTKLEAYVLNERVLNSMFQVCYHTSNAEFAMELFNNVLRTSNMQLSPSSLNYLLSTCYSAGRYDIMETIWTQLATHMIPFNYTLCILMLQCYSSTNQFEKAGALLESMQQNGIANEKLHAHILAAKSCIQCGEWKLALGILRSAGSQRRIELYNAVLAACATAQEWDNIVTLEQEIRNLMNEQNSHLHYNGDTIAYFILAHHNLQNHDQVRKLLNAPVVDTAFLSKLRNNLVTD